MSVGIFDGSASATGVDSVDFRIEHDGNTIVNQSFTDMVAAEAYFADTALVLELFGFELDGIVKFSLDVTASEGGSFSTYVVAAVTVPEPGTAVLLGFALVVVARARRR